MMMRKVMKKPGLIKQLFGGLMHGFGSGAATNDEMGSLGLSGTGPSRREIEQRRKVEKQKKKQKQKQRRKNR
jgi:hypothetical protein